MAIPGFGEEHTDVGVGGCSGSGRKVEIRDWIVRTKQGCKSGWYSRGGRSMRVHFGDGYIKASQGGGNGRRVSHLLVATIFVKAKRRI